MTRIFSNLVLGFFIVLLFSVYAIANQDAPKTSVKEKKPAVQSDKVVTTERKDKSIVLNGKTIFVDIADEHDERIQGLSGRETMNADSGLLFVFDSLENQVIWMKDMKFNIDIIWIDEDGTVVHIEQDAKKPEPGMLDIDLPLYASMEPTKYILEVASGVAASSNLKVGDKVEIQI